MIICNRLPYVHKLYVRRGLFEGEARAQNFSTNVRFGFRRNVRSALIGRNEKPVVGGLLRTHEFTTPQMNPYHRPTPSVESTISPSYHTHILAHLRRNHPRPLRLYTCRSYAARRSKLVDRRNRPRNQWQLSNFAISHNNLATLTGSRISIASDIIDSYGIY